jgi:Ca-activated chloride channel family protein
MHIKEAVLLVKGQHKQVPLQGIRIEAEVLDLVCSTTMVQTYQNTEKNPVEAVYCFPIEEGAAVYDFEIKTGGKTLKGIVEERDKAFETYDKALETGDASFLLDRESGDILYLSVGNIKSNQKVTIRISYVKKLSFVDGVMRLQIPTTVSPRYAPPDTDPLKVDRITPEYDLEVPYRLTLSVKLKSNFTADVTSPSHNIKSSTKGEYTIVNLENGSTSLDRDFVLEIKAVNLDKPVCLWSTHENGDKACMFRFTPHLDELQGEEEQKSEIIFMLDCSASMRGSSIAEAREALELSLRALSEGELFNIVRFGSSFQAYQPQSMKYSGKSLKDALDYLQGLDADMGGTEIYRPLQYICSLPARGGYNRDVVLITDGEVANPDDVICLVADSVEKNPSLRVFTIGIGYGASYHLVKGTAKAGRGACEMIMPGEIIQPKVLRQLSRMDQPSLFDVSLSFKATKAETVKTLPPLFESDSYNVFGKLGHVEAGAKVTFSGYYLGNRCDWSAELIDVGRDNIIPTLWALSRIEHLKTMSVGGSNQKGRRKQRNMNEIIKLSLRYNLLTDYTSFVAVEQRAEGKKQLEQPEYMRIPVMMTKDWHGISRGYLNLARMVKGGPYPDIERHTFHTMGAPGIIQRSKLFRKTKRNVEFFGRPMLKRSIPTQGPKKAEQPWCLKLLKTQHADGSFTGLYILSAYLGISLKKLIYFSGMVDGISSDQREKALATWLAVNVLSAEPDLLTIASRAIRKAKKWLSQHIVKNLTVSGIPIKEEFERRFSITLD